ncbi:hypothetical protein HU148_10520, partial [Streptococcus suis]|uniref:hypothetical protein n=1 Tax=Streptococcus suis TaxID=1307 RepID=UPI001592B73A
RYLRFSSALIITNNSTSLICPFGVNASVKAGDIWIANPKTTAGVTDGWWIIRLTANTLPGASTIYGLTGESDATTPTTKFNLRADAVVTRANTYQNVTTKQVDITLASQIGGRDQAAAFAAFDEPNLFFVPDGSGGLGVVASLANANTGPTGYSEWALAANLKLNGGAQIIQGNVMGNYFQLSAVSAVVSNSGGAFPTSSSYSTFCPLSALDAFFTSKAIAGTNAGGGGTVIPLIGMGNNILDNCDVFINTANGSGSTCLKARLPVAASSRSITYGQSNAAGNLATYSQTVYLTGYTMRNGAR